MCADCWRSIPVSPSDDGRGGHDLESVSALAAIAEYDGRLRDIIHALKYGGRRSIAPKLARLMRESGAALLADADVVVPVPLHSRRQRMRGFNQAHDLARHLGVPVQLLLRRVRFAVPQVDLTGEERRRNVRDAFALARGVRMGGSLDARRGGFLDPPAVVVLVDDVLTTGATIDACARVLKRAGVKEIRALTAARVSSAPRR